MIMMLQTLQRGNVAFLWAFYSKPLINKTRDLLKVEEQPGNTIILSLNIHYKLFDVPKFGHINEFKDFKSQDISTIDVTVDLFANLGTVIIMEFKTANWRYLVHHISCSIDKDNRHLTFYPINVSNHSARNHSY